MKVTIRSEKQPQSGQDHRSSNNFTTADFPENATLTFEAYYDYGEKDQRETKDIVFDIKVDKTGHDPTYLEKITSGTSSKNTHHRNLYVANPVNATKAFTVVVQG